MSTTKAETETAEFPTIPTSPSDLREIEVAQREWALRNFGEEVKTYKVNGAFFLLHAVASLGKASHHHLKQEQGIRGTALEHQRRGLEAADIAREHIRTYRGIRGETRPASYGTPGLKPLLGVIEEVGELAKAYIAANQGAGVSEVRDAVGDICIYLMDFCNRNGWSLADVIAETWAGVAQRDWVKNQKNGVTA